MRAAYTLTHGCLQEILPQVPQGCPLCAIACIEGHQDVESCIVISPDSKFFASGSYDTSIKLWHADTCEAKYTLQGHEGPVLCLDFIAEGSMLISGSTDKTVKLWDLNAPTGLRLLRTFSRQSGSICSVKASPDNKTIATASYNSPVIIWDIHTGEQLQTLRDNKLCIRCLIWLDSKLIASGGADGTISIQEASHLQILGIFDC